MREIFISHLFLKSLKFVVEDFGVAVLEAGTGHVGLQLRQQGLPVADIDARLVPYLVLYRLLQVDQLRVGFALEQVRNVLKHRLIYAFVSIASMLFYNTNYSE